MSRDVKSGENWEGMTSASTAPPQRRTLTDSIVESDTAQVEVIDMCRQHGRTDIPGINMKTAEEGVGTLSA